MKAKVTRLFKEYYISVLSVVAFLSVWEIASRMNETLNIFVGTPTGAINEFINFFTAENILTYVLPSMEALLIGLVLSIFLGVLIGFLISLNQNVYRAFRPFIFTLNAIPAIVFLPLIIIFMGISVQSVVLAIVLMSVIPIVINVTEGIRNTDTSLIKMAQSFGANKFIILQKVVFPSVLPYLFSGVRIAIGKSLVALIIAELYGLNKGLGYLIAFYGSTVQTSRLIGIVLFILIINGILLILLRMAEKKILRTEPILKNLITVGGKYE